MENNNNRDDPSFKKFLETIKKQNDASNAAQAVSIKKEDVQVKSLEKIASLLENIQANFAVKAPIGKTGPTAIPKKTGSLNKAAVALSQYSVPQEDKTVTEKLKEEVAATKSVFGSLGKGISSIFNVSKGLLTNPEEMFSKGLKKTKSLGKKASDILGTKEDYTVEKERFVREVKAQGGKGGAKLYDSLMSTAKEEKKKQNPLTRIVSDVLGKDKDTGEEKPVVEKKTKKTKEKTPSIESDTNESNDNFVSAQEQLAKNSETDLELTKQILEVQKQQLTELQKLSSAFVSKIPSELPGPAPTVSKKDTGGGEEDSGSGLSLLDALPGKGALKSLGKGARALGRGALKAGTGLLKFAGSKAGMVAGGALAIGAGAYTAYKGYTGAEEEKQAGLQEIEAKQQAGEITPEEAEAQKKQLGEATIEKKGGAVGEGAGMAAGGIAGMKAGAALGATIGSIVPGAGTAVGAGIGAVAGGALGAFAGSKAGKVVGEYGGKAVNKIKDVYGSAKDLFSRGTSGTLAFQNKDEEVNKRALEAGAIDEAGNIVNKEKYSEIKNQVDKEVIAKDPTANKLSDISVSSETKLLSKSESGPDGTASSDIMTKGIVSEKSILGSTKLGALFSAKGLDTGRFLSASSEESVDKEGNVKSRFSDISGSRKSGGLLGADTYTLTNEGAEGGPVYDMKVSKKDYMRMQGLAKEGKHAEAEKEFANLKAKRDMTYQDVSPVASPEESVTPMSDEAGKGKFGFANIGAGIKKFFGMGKKDVSTDEEAQKVTKLGAQLKGMEALRGEGGKGVSEDISPELKTKQEKMKADYEAGVQKLTKEGWDENTLRDQQSGVHTLGNKLRGFFGMKLKEDEGFEGMGMVSADQSTTSQRNKDLAKKASQYSDDTDVSPKPAAAAGPALAQDSVENKDLSREASKPAAAAQPIISNNVSNSSKTVITPPKPTPRNTELDVSPLKDYQRRAVVF